MRERFGSQTACRKRSGHETHEMRFDGVLEMCLLREALFTSVRTVKTGMCVRSFVRPSVRKVITFCEEDMRGDHVPLDLGVLNDRFFRF